MSAHTDATAGQEPSNAELLLDFGASDSQQSNGPTNGNHINGNFSQFNETNGHGAFDPLGDFGGHTNPFAEDTNPFQCKEATPPKHSDIDIFKSQFDPPPQEPKQAWPGEGQDPFAAHEFDEESSPASFREKSPEPASLHDLEAEPHSDMMEPSAKELSPNPFLKEAIPEPLNDKSPEPSADDFSLDPFQKELSSAPDLREPSPEPFMKDQSPEPFMREESPEPFMREESPEPVLKEAPPEPLMDERSPEPFAKELSPEPFAEEVTAELREPSPDPFMKDASPDPFMKSPEPFEREPSPEPEASSQPFMQEASPQPFENEASPQPFEKEASPQPFAHESAPEPFMKEPSPQPEALRDPSPEPFTEEPTPELREPSPEPFMKDPEPFHREASPEPLVKVATPEPCEEVSPDPFAKETTPDLREPSPEPLMREPSPEPFMKEPSPEPFMKEPSPEPFMSEPSPEPIMSEPSPEPFMREPSPEPLQKEASPEPFMKEATPEPFAPGATEIDFEKSPSPFAKEATPDSLREPSPEPFMKEASPEPIEKEASPEPVMEEPTPEPKEVSPAPLAEPIPESAVKEATPEPVAPLVPVAPVAAVKKAPSPTKQKSLSPTKEKSPKAPTPTKTAPKSAKPEAKKAATPTKTPATKPAPKTAPAKPPTTKPAVPKTTATKPAVPKTALAPKAPAPKPAVPKAAPAKPKEAPKAPATAKPAPKPAVPKAPRSVKSDVKPPPAKDPAKPDTRKSSASPSRIATRKTEVSKTSSSSMTKTTTATTSVKKAPAAKPSSAPPSRTRTAAAKSSTPERKTPDRTAKSTDSKPEWDWTISNPQKEKKLPPAPRQAKSADIESRKLEWKVESKVGSLDNATHKPGGGAKKRRRGVDLEYLESLGDGTAAFYAAILDDSNLTLVGKLGQHGADFGSALEGSTVIVTGHVKDLNESSDDVIDASKMADLLGLAVESGELKIDGPGTDVKAKLEKAKIRLNGTSSLTKRKEADLNGAVVVILNDDDMERPLLLEKAKMTILDSENKPTDVKDFGFIFDGVPIELESTVGGDNGEDGCLLQDSKLKICCANPCTVIRKSEFEVSGKANAKKKTAAFDSGMHGAGMAIMGNVGEKTTPEKIEWSENSVKIPIKDANLKMRLKGEKAEKFTIDDSFGNGFVRIESKDKNDEIVDFLGGQDFEITGSSKVSKKGTEGTGLKVQLTSGETQNEITLDNAMLKFSGVEDKVLDGANFVISGSLPEAKSAADILKDEKITLVGIATVAKDDCSMATEMENVEVRIEGTVKESDKVTLASKKEDPNGISLKMKNSKLEFGADPGEMHNSKITVTGKTHGDGAKSKIDGAQIFVTDRTGKKTRNMALDNATISLKNADGQDVDASKLGKIFNDSEIRLTGKLDTNEEANLKDSEIWITGAKGAEDAVKGGVITLEGKAKVPKSSAAYQAGLNDTTVRIQAVAKGSDAKLPEGGDSAYSSLLSKGEIEIKTAYDPEPKVVEFEQARIEVLGKPNDELFGYLSGAKFDIKGEAKPTKTACDLKNANCKIEGDSDFVLSDARLSLDEEKSRDDLNRLMGGATVRISGQTPEMKDTAAILDGAKVTLKGKAKVTGDKAKLGGDLDGKKVVIKGGLKFLGEADNNDVECGAKDSNRVGMTFSDMEIELEGSKDAADLEGSGLTLTGHPELDGEKCVLKDGEILVKKGRKINRFSLEGAEVEIHDENTGDKKPVTGFDKIFNGSNLVVSGKMAGPDDSGKGSMRDVTGSISGARRPEVLLTQGKNLVISGKVSCKKGSPAHDAGMNGTAITISGSTDPDKTPDVSGNTVTVENSKLAINTGYSDMDRLLSGVVIGMDEKVDPDFLNGVELDFEGNGDSLKVIVKSSTGSDSEFVIEKLNVTLEDGTKLDNDDLKRMLQDAKLKMTGKTIKRDRPADVLKNKEVTVSGTVNCSDAKAKDLNGKSITITTKVAGKVEDYTAPKEKSKSASIGGSLDNAKLGFEGDCDVSGAEVEIVGKVHLDDDGEYTLDGGNIIVANHGGKHAKKVALESVKIDVGEAKKNFGYFEGTDMKLSGKMGCDGKFEATSIRFENLKTDSEKFAFITDHTMEISGVCKALPGCTDKVASLKDKKLIVRGRCDENKTGPEDMEFNPDRVEVKDAKISMAGQDGTKFDCDLHEGEFEVEDDPQLANFFNGAKIKVKKEKNFLVTIDKGEEKGDLSFRTASVWFEGTDPDKMLRLFMSSIFTLDGRLVATPFDADGNYRTGDLDGAEIDISGKATGGEGHSDLSGTKLKIVNKNGSGKTIDGDFVNAAIIVEDCEGDEFKGAVNIKGKVVNTDDGVGIKNGKISLKGGKKAGSKIHINGTVANCKDPDMNGVQLTISATIGPNGELENAVVRGGSAQSPDQEFQEAAGKNKAKVRARSGRNPAEASEIADEDLPDEAFEVDEHGNFLLDEHGRRIRKSIFDEKLNWDADKKVDTWNPKYKPSQIEKKTMFHEDLEWKAEKKLDTFNKDYKPGGGNKKVVVNHKLKWEGKSRLNTGMSKPTPKKEGNGNGKKIVDEKVQVKAESKVGSLDNSQHKAGGGDKK